MSALQNIEELSTLFDVKVETLAAILLDQNKGNREFGLDNILVAPVGSHHRKAGRDIAEIREKYFEFEEALMFKVNRKGLYDTLPERLFLKLDSTFDSPKKRTKELKRQEAEARKFFLPFDQAMYHPRIEIQRFEQKYTSKFPSFVRQLWGLEKYKSNLTEGEINLLCYVIPQAPRVVGNWELTALIFQSVLKKPVEFDFIRPQILRSPVTKASATIEGELGVDTIMGDEFMDEFPVLRIIIKGITAKDLVDYLPLGERREILVDVLCSYFIALDVPYEISLQVTEDSLGFELDENVLGFNTCLN